MVRSAARLVLVEDALELAVPLPDFFLAFQVRGVLAAATVGEHVLRSSLYMPAARLRCAHAVIHDTTAASPADGHSSRSSFVSLSIFAQNSSSSASKTARRWQRGCSWESWGSD